VVDRRDSARGRGPGRLMDHRIEGIEPKHLVTLDVFLDRLQGEPYRPGLSPETSQFSGVRGQCPGTGGRR